MTTSLHPAQIQLRDRRDEDKAIYGGDSRQDEADTTDFWRSIGRSTVILTSSSATSGSIWRSCGTLGSRCKHLGMFHPGSHTPTRVRALTGDNTSPVGDLGATSVAAAQPSSSMTPPAPCHQRAHSFAVARPPHPTPHAAAGAPSTTQTAALVGSGSAPR